MTISRVQHNAVVAKSDPGIHASACQATSSLPHALPACAIPLRCVAISPSPPGNRSPADARRGQARGETGPARADHELARTRAASDHTSPGPTSQQAGSAGALDPTEPPMSTYRPNKLLDDQRAPSSNHRSPRRPIEE
jgi:hypothetical protein